MSIESDVVTRDGYIAVICRGEYSLESMRDVVGNAFDVTIEASCSGVVVDVRGVASAPSVGDRFEIVKLIAETQRSRGRGIAFALLGHEPFIDPERFGETVARNRGASFRAFTDHDEAVRFVTR